ncbi:M16 family metallopeptidase [Pseudomonas sp. nanlin1]|uniref:M16 family metallopeptidase n=1 Tax=Pseudomonas sp. nanlin1 TaxID=3040605 RepID=UPI00388FCE9D
MSEHYTLRATCIGLLMAALVSGCVGTAEKPKQAPEQPENGQGSLLSLAELDRTPPSVRQLQVQTWTTRSGSRVLFVEARQLPMFDLRLTFAAGSSQDQARPGIALLTNAMLNEGVAGKDVGAIAAGFEGLGAEFSNGAYRDMAVASLRSLSAVEKRQPALRLFSQVVGQPTLPADSLARIKNQLLAGFDYQKQDPSHLASQRLFERLYGQHPYAHPSEGNPQSVTSITREQMRQFHQKAYAAGNAVIALVGDLSRDEAQAIAEQVSSALPKGPALAEVAQPQRPSAGASHIEFPSKQTQILLAELGIDRNDPDYPALAMGSQILGGGSFGTRLMTEVREKRGLTYGIYSGFTPMQVRGPFTISLQTRAELSEGTLTLVKDLLRDYLKTGPTQQELDEAKRELAGSFPLSTASNESIVGQLGAIGFYGLPLSFLEDFMQQSQNLTVEQVRTAMNKHLDADQLVIVTVGPTVAQQPLPPPTDKPVEAPTGVPEH